MEIQCQGTAEGSFRFTPFARATLKRYLQQNPGVRLTITADLPESGKLRKYFEGALVPLIAYYHETLDHRSSLDRLKIREWLKEEFNGELVEIGGKVHTVAKSTKGREQLNAFVERVVDWLTENYAPPAEAMDPEKYKHWRNAIFPYGGPDTYIDYLVSVNILKPYEKSM